MSPSFIAAPTSVDVIDFAMEKEFQRVVGLCGATYRSRRIVPSCNTRTPRTRCSVMNRSR